MNSIERKQGSFSVLHCDKSKKEVCVKERHGINPATKAYSFDHVFPPDAEQIDVYKAVVKPVVEEVLTGYNCTIFAYVTMGSFHFIKKGIYGIWLCALFQLFPFYPLII